VESVRRTPFVLIALTLLAAAGEFWFAAAMAADILF